MKNETYRPEPEEIANSVIYPVANRLICDSSSIEGIKAKSWWTTIFDNCNYSDEPGKYLRLAETSISETEQNIEMVGSIERLIMDASREYLKFNESGRKTIFQVANFFNMREDEKEYRFYLDSQLVEDYIPNRPIDLTRFDTDIIDSDGLARVRFSMKPNLCNRINIKLPILENQGGGRERIKFEYRGLPDNNDKHQESLNKLGLRLIEGKGQMFVRFGYLLVDRFPGKYPLWLNGLRVVNNKILSDLGNIWISETERIGLLKKVVESPLKYTEPVKNSYWFEIDAQNQTELNAKLKYYEESALNDLATDVIKSRKISRKNN